MRVLLTGAGGRLGRDLVHALADDEVAAFDRRSLDVTDEAAVWAAVRDHAPEVVINAAAFTGAGACEADPEAAWAVNAGGAANLARASEAADALMVQISTHEVFDGTLDRPYTEFDRPTPASLFGRTKEAGEQLVRELCHTYQIVRSGWLQSVRRDDFVCTVLREAGAGRPVSGVTDALGNPTFTTDLAPAIRRLAATRRTGTYHVTNSGACTWSELAAETLRVAGLDPQGSETSARTVSSRTRQPANDRLDGRNARIAGLDPLPTWRDALVRFVSQCNP